MQITLTNDILSSLKRALRKDLPCVGSSHLSEALAAGVGYQSSSRLKNMIQRHGSISRYLDDAGFSLRLASLTGSMDADEAMLRAALCTCPEALWCFYPDGKRFLSLVSETETAGQIVSISNLASLRHAAKSRTNGYVSEWDGKMMSSPWLVVHGAGGLRAQVWDRVILWSDHEEHTCQGPIDTFGRQWIMEYEPINPVQSAELRRRVSILRPNPSQRTLMQVLKSASPRVYHLKSALWEALGHIKEGFPGYSSIGAVIKADGKAAAISLETDFEDACPERSRAIKAFELDIDDTSAWWKAWGFRAHQAVFSLQMAKARGDLEAHLLPQELTESAVLAMEAKLCLLRDPESLAPQETEWTWPDWGPCLDN